MFSFLHKPHKKKTNIEKSKFFVGFKSCKNGSQISELKNGDFDKMLEEDCGFSEFLFIGKFFNREKAFRMIRQKVRLSSRYDTYVIGLSCTTDELEDKIVRKGFSTLINEIVNVITKKRYKKQKDSGHSSNEKVTSVSSSL